MTFLLWNCRGAGGSSHLARLIITTKSQVCFISETRNSSISRSSLINKFKAADAFVASSIGQSGGLWLIWMQDISVNVVHQSHHFIFVVCNNKLDNCQFGLVCIYGDPHHHLLQTIWMQVYSFVQAHNDMPMFCMGDMNEIMHPNEKHGPGRPDMRRINTFSEAVKQCGFLNLGYSGPAYTWTNKRFTSTPTFQRLDRCLANAEWCLHYPRTTVFHLPMLRSDHAPILALLDSRRRNIVKPFRFENWWLLEEDYDATAKESWAKSASRPFHQKTKYLANDLKKMASQKT